MKKEMKKRCEWVMKSHKRIKKKKDRGIVDFAMIQNHFFKQLPEWINQMEEKFNEDVCISTLGRLSGDRSLKEMPHYDTLNYYLEKLSPDCLSDIRKKMIKSLLRGKQFYRYRLLGKYFRVIPDGTVLP